MGNDTSSIQHMRGEYFQQTNGVDKWESLPGNQPNQWLDGEEIFRKTMLEYWNGCCVASSTILQALAMSLGLSKYYFTEKHKKHDCSMELKKYPPIHYQQFHTRLPPHLAGLRIPKKSEEEGESDGSDHRFNEHSDLSSITLLIQTPNIDCLEVKNTNNEWIKAKAHTGAVLVNTGDVIEQWTNGLYPSTRHRVVTNRGQTADRFSVVFFCMPDWETKISPIPSLSDSPPQNTHLFGDLIPFM